MPSSIHHAGIANSNCSEPSSLFTARCLLSRINLWPPLQSPTTSAITVHHHSAPPRLQCFTSASLPSSISHPAYPPLLPLAAPPSPPRTCAHTITPSHHHEIASPVREGVMATATWFLGKARQGQARPGYLRLWCDAARERSTGPARAGGWAGRTDWRREELQTVTVPAARQLLLSLFFLSFPFWTEMGTCDFGFDWVVKLQSCHGY
ncbi:hypothetical protein M0R45_014512 [Rubus argutus]|uniref:Uncharacterized protein n=1 Tax=Rubus argutus TaxID=59490 RepID=A0AAW1XPA7_RUBAR